MTLPFNRAIGCNRRVLSWAALFIVPGFWTLDSHAQDSHTKDTALLSSHTTATHQMVAANNSAERSLISIQRLTAEEAAESGATSVSEDTYVDKLITGTLSQKQSSNFYDRSPDSSGNIFHTIQASTYYRDGSELESDSLDSGVEYIGFMPSNNYGDFRLNLVALNEDDSNFRYNNNLPAVGSDRDRSQQGLRRYSLEQLGLPLKENLSMDNILGTHRQSRNLPYRNRVTVVNQRFGSSEPDILGLTSRLYTRNSGMSLSYGDLGETRGTVLPGFVKTDGQVGRFQAHHIAEAFTLSGDLWNTKDLAIDEFDRTGARINWQAIWANGLESTTTLATSDDSVAALFGASQQLSGFRHDGGAYYFEPKFIWIDTQIGDDFMGAYYRFNHSYRTLHYGGSFEQRRDGLEGDSRKKRDTSYMTLNGNYRISRSGIFSSTYSYRNIENRNAEPMGVSSTTHNIRGAYSLQHAQSTRSSIGATVREREGETSQRIHYNVFHDLNNDSRGELSLEYQREDGDAYQSDGYRVELGWQTGFAYGSSLSVGTGYNYNDNNVGSGTGWNGYLNYDLPIGRKFLLSAQLDYNRAEYDIDRALVADDLFTDNVFDEDESTQSDQFSASLNLRYSFGGNISSNILAANGSSRGSGSVIGRLFLDENGDGIAQQDEKGLNGVVVYLNSIYPVTTDINGQFEFKSVGPGEHHIFIDESALPLPWSLNGAEYAELRVNLRDTTLMEIPVSRL